MIVPINTSANCSLWNFNNTRFLRNLPGLCQLRPGELEMGTTYFLRVFYRYSSFQDPIAANISLTTIYENPEVAISN
jgi:REJ domain